MQLPIDTFENYVLGMDRVEVVFGYPDDLKDFLLKVCVAVQDRVYDDQETYRHFEVEFKPQPAALPDLHQQYGPYDNAVRVLSIAVRQGLIARGWPVKSFRIDFDHERDMLVARGEVEDLRRG